MEHTINISVVGLRGIMKANPALKLYVFGITPVDMTDPAILDWLIYRQVWLRDEQFHVVAHYFISSK